MTTITENPKCQLNYAVKRNGKNEIIEKSTLLNIRCDDLNESLDLYKKMKAALNGELVGDEIKQEANEPFPDNLFMKPGDQTGIQCPQCGKNLLLRSSKSGNSFYGCAGFPTCKHTQPA